MLTLLPQPLKYINRFIVMQFDLFHFKSACYSSVPRYDLLHISCFDYWQKYIGKKYSATNSTRIFAIAALAKYCIKIVLFKPCESW